MTTGSQRIEGLDAWRALLMLGGLVLHATLLKEPTPLFYGIAIASGSFRMGSFFAISGVLAGFATAQRPARAWLARRSFQIGVPMIFALTVICPLTTALTMLAPAAVMRRAPVLFDWQHAWFLVALFLYAPCAVLLDAAARRPMPLLPIAGGPAAAMRVRVVVFVGLPVICLSLMEATMLAIAHLAPHAYWAALSQCRLIVGYLPVYALGFVLARSAHLRDLLTARLAFPIAVLALVIASYLIWFGLVDGTGWSGSRPWVEPLLALVASALCPPAMLAIVLRSARRVRHLPRPLRRLAEASFTIYIVHFPIMVLLNLGFAYVAADVHLEYVVVLGLGSWLSYRLHTHVVCRSPLAALLINGKKPAGRRMVFTLPA